MSVNAKDLTYVLKKADRLSPPKENPSRHLTAHPQPQNQNVAFETWNAGLE